MASLQVEPKSFAFIFPMASGHINPSLPIARCLVELGHRVHYLVREQMREAVEDTGGSFHSDIAHLSELYQGREPDFLGAVESLKKEFGLEADGVMHAGTKLAHVQLELMLPGVVRWLESTHADAVLCCPMLNPEAIYAAKSLGIPSVGVFTTAGPGSLKATWKELIDMLGQTIEDMHTIYDTYEPHKEAVRRMNSKYGLTISSHPNLNPFGWLDVLKHSYVTIVTTCEALQDPVSPEVAEACRRDRVRFEYTGPLLDKEGAHRAGTHKFKDDGEAAEASADKAATAARNAEVLTRVRAARAAGRRVALVSMGTVITGDSPEWGWSGRMPGPDGVRRGLTGMELCHGAWGGAFDALGAGSEQDGPLLVVAVGAQPRALGDLVAPANAICLPLVPQVDILKLGVDIFLTHGGQNSFTEALAHKVPVVVCPGFGDQPVNARKAEAMGVGLQVPRPNPDLGEEAVAAAVAQYRRDVAEALRRVIAEDGFREKAAECGDQLQNAGGVPRAVELVLEAAATRQAAPAEKSETLAEAKGLSAFAGA